MKQLLVMLLFAFAIALSSSSPPNSDLCDDLRKDNETLQKQVDSLECALTITARDRDDWHENFSNLRRNHLLLIEKLDTDGAIKCQDFGFYVDALQLTCEKNRDITNGSSGGLPFSRQDTCNCIDERMKY